MEENTPPLIQLKNIHKRYPYGKLFTSALNGLSLVIEAGEFTAIAGPSGGGKTTLLNVIGGLDHPSEGEVRINGKNIAQLREKELSDFRLQQIGFVFQAHNLLPILNAEENASLVMQLQKRPPQETKKRIRALLAEVGLGNKAKNRPSELSGGQKQKIAVIRALAPKPAFILADEPTANLDSISTDALLESMLRLNQQERITFIFSTHDPRVLERASRVVYLKDGKIVRDEKSRH